jgi:hypothetical protein
MATAANTTSVDANATLSAGQVFPAMDDFFNGLLPFLDLPKTIADYLRLR